VSSYYENIISSDDQSYYIEDQEDISYYSHTYNTIDTITVENSDRVNISNDMSQGLFSLYIYLTTNVQKYQRSFMKLQELLALIGGLFNIAFGSMKVIMRQYNMFKRDISLIDGFFTFDENEIKEDIKENIKEDKDRELQIVINNSNNKNVINIPKESLEVKTLNEMSKFNNDSTYLNQNFDKDKDNLKENKENNAISNENNIKDLREIEALDNSLLSKMSKDIKEDSDIQINVLVNHSSININTNLFNNERGDNKVSSNIEEKETKSKLQAEEVRNNILKDKKSKDLNTSEKHIILNNPTNINNTFQYNYDKIDLGRSGLSPKNLEFLNNSDSDSNINYKDITKKVKVAIDNLKLSRRQQIGVNLFSWSKYICCSSKMTFQENNRFDIYSLCCEYLEEKMDILNYLKLLKQFDHMKYLSLNYFQNRSLEYLKPINMYNLKERAEVDNELKLIRNKDEYTKEKVEELIKLIIYYINFEKKNDESKESNESKKSLIDKKLMKSLIPLITSIIQESTK